ncbi:oxidoreductase [Aspergillus ellipticus CBS 707.79]|uniref:Oxidoreductase n=1 Tax=Aspergillus ellipticus CBS 707.79 TaxID=1448320 RepID=A0A319DK09_9EURO|nr:oxidoreductase [Aspergillus ellipticus CBS 707.79]
MTHLVSINKLANQRVLLIGGTSGVGFAVARAALEHGANIVLSSSNPLKVSSAVSRLKTLYPEPSYTNRITGFACDLGDQATMEANLIALLQYSTTPSLFPSPSPTPTDQTLTPLDHIIYTSGTRPPPTPVSSPTVTPSTFTTSGTLRVIAPILLGKHAKTYLRDTSSTSLTFTSGILGQKPVPGMALGAAMGTALDGLTRALAVELAPMRVNTVSLGAVETELFEGFGEQKEMYLGVFRKGTLSGELGRPEDVAEAYVWCMKDRFVTGERISSDGGWMLKGVF